MRRPAKPILYDHRNRPLASSSMARGGYDSASRARRLAGWSPAASGPNAAFQGDHTLLRARSRHEIRNNSIAKSAVDGFVSDIIGTGITPRWTLADSDLAASFFEVFQGWTDEADADGLLDFYGLQALVSRTLFASGEVLIRRRPRRMTDGLSVPLQLEVLEPDYLDSSKNFDEGGRRCRMGVEFDATGKRIAYWLHKSHPGDGLTTSFESHRVPASEVIHCFVPDRPKQVRGVPWTAPVLVKLNSIEKSDDANLVKQEIGSLLAGFIEQAAEDDDEGLGSTPGAQVQPDYGEIVWEPGTMSVLPPGKRVSWSDPPDVGSSEAFVRSQLRAIASALSTTYEQLTGDLTGVNYSSIRAGILAQRRKIEALQHHIIIFQVCRPIVGWWMDMAVASGAVDAPDYFETKHKYRRSIEWLPAAWDWVDPTKDITAMEKGANAGFLTRDEVIAKLGKNGEQVDRDNAAIAERERKYGLEYTTSVRSDRQGGPRSVQSLPLKDDDLDEDKVEDDEDEQREARRARR